MSSVNIVPADALAPCITKASAGMYGPSLDETVSHPHDKDNRLILGLRPANERRRYFVTMSLIGWAQT